MNYKLLGYTGLRVSEICLGTMTFGKEWEWGADKTESKKIFDAFVQAGGNFIDTANRYTEGTSEKLVGEFIHADRDKFVVATKYSLFDRLHDVNFSGNHRKNMMRSVEASLRRMNTEYIDVFYLHIWDFTTPMEEVLRGMDDLVTQGKILYAGISDTPAWRIAEANTMADIRNTTRFNALQVEYSLIQRTVEREFLPLAKAKDMAITAWAPLAGGALTGKYLKPETADSARVKDNNTRRSERSIAITQAVVKIAEELGCTPAQVAIRWVMQRNQVVIPIVGATKESQIKDGLGALDIVLQDHHLQMLDEVSKIQMGFPHDFFNEEGVKNVSFGQMKDKILHHRV